MNTLFISSLRMLLVLTALCGVIFPVLATALAQWGFPHQANGSLVHINGQPVGSRLLAQAFTNEMYFQPRPSAAQYATAPSGAGNQGGTSANLRKAIEERKAYWNRNGKSATNIPPELLLASGSGLDPHIRLESALFQLDRVARARGFDPEQKTACENMVKQRLEKPQWGFLGESRINVFLLNCAIEKYASNDDER